MDFARRMNKQKLLISLLAMAVIVYSFSARAADSESMIWWELKSDSRDSLTSPGKPKSLVLYWGKFTVAGHDEDIISRAVKSNRAKAWIRSPDGALSEANLSLEKETVVLDFPTKLNLAKFNGLYLVGIHVDAGVKDINLDGTDGTVHYYAKYLIYHQKDDGLKADKPDVFFKDADKIALEIGPSDAPCMGEMPCMKAGCQEALKEHKMKVLYKGGPLADAEVAILTESGWEKRKKTNSNGIFSITPVENKEKENRSLYVVTHKDLSNGQYYCSSLMMYVLKPPPGWMSKAEGFVFWAVMGTGLFVVYVGWRIIRRKRFDRKTMLEFERHKIRRD